MIGSIRYTRISWTAPVQSHCILWILSIFILDITRKSDNQMFLYYVSLNFTFKKMDSQLPFLFTQWWTVWEKWLQIGEQLPCQRWWNKRISVLFTCRSLCRRTCHVFILWQFQSKQCSAVSQHLTPELTTSDGQQETQDDVIQIPRLKVLVTNHSHWMHFLCFVVWELLFFRGSVPF